MALLPLATKIRAYPRVARTPPTAPRQLDLGLDDVRLRGMHTGEQHKCFRSLRICCSRASGIATEGGWRWNTHDALLPASVGDAQAVVYGRVEAPAGAIPTLRSKPGASTSS